MASTPSFWLFGPSYGANPFSWTESPPSIGSIRILDDIWIDGLRIDDDYPNDRDEVEKRLQDYIQLRNY